MRRHACTLRLSEPSCRHTIFHQAKAGLVLGKNAKKWTNFKLILAQRCRHTKRLAQNCTNRSGQNLPKSSPKVFQPQFADTLYLQSKEIWKRSLEAFSKNQDFLLWIFKFYHISRLMLIKPYITCMKDVMNNRHMW